MLYVGLDVSVKRTAVCIMDSTGKVARETPVESTPEAIAAAIGESRDEVERVGLEAGVSSAWLARGLIAIGLPAIVIDVPAHQPEVVAGDDREQPVPVMLDLMQPANSVRWLGRGLSRLVGGCRGAGRQEPLRWAVEISTWLAGWRWGVREQTPRAPEVREPADRHASSEDGRAEQLAGALDKVMQLGATTTWWPVGEPHRRRTNQRSPYARSLYAGRRGKAVVRRKPSVRVSLRP